MIGFPQQELTINKKKYKMQFTGFSRNPYLAVFRSGQFVFTLANVHILYGKGTAGLRRRIGEVYALANNGLMIGSRQSTRGRLIAISFL